MAGLDPAISRSNLMLSLSKYEVVALVLRQAQDEGSVEIEIPGTSPAMTNKGDGALVGAAFKPARIA